MKIYLLIVLAVLLVSCEKVIQLKPADKQDKYVIEGTITNEPGTCSVLISKTKNFDDDNTFNGVSGAVVKIENNGNSITLPETSMGVYKTSAINGTPGQTYRLTATVNGETFTATSTMQDPIPFLDFYLKPKDFDSLRTVAYVKYKDSAEIKNYYWFELFVNDKRQDNYSLANDDFTTGQVINSGVIFQNTTKNRAKDIKRGDKLGVEMHSIDASVYLYLFSLTGAKGSGNNAAPANPISNITGGALGYFSAHTTQRKSLIIP
ncbi:hypothetical protein HDE68_002300 [Pedobacter cryoconitis]|uniref:DUF4249 domain-containing protein n=1 Tax=Pedobacter cryoconitis TaxID=188932 RepID=A0A7W9DZM7_9SPHI|nr:DUF4249 domain-containing protein [Pedobacter cryoconitis]MBB5636399.1 hypothetical protein [Pedobacter cryoconitis]